MTEESTWTEWSQFVLKELERLNDELKEVKAIVSDIKTDLTVIKVKASLFGAGAGAIMLLIPTAIKILHG